MNFITIRQHKTVYSVKYSKLQQLLWNGALNNISYEINLYVIATYIIIIYKVIQERSLVFENTHSLKLCCLTIFCDKFIILFPGKQSLIQRQQL